VLRQRAAFADVAQFGHLVSELDDNSSASPRSPRSPSKSVGWHDDRAAGESVASRFARQSGVMGPRAGSNRRSRFGWRIHRAFDDRPHAGAPAPDQGRAFRRGLTVAEMPRALFASEFPDDGGTAP
jgi:hypothetical protein